MAEVSKLVRDRLAQTPPAGPHPDAAVLNAFAEQALTAREREPVMAHLASCAGCREIVALAAPATAPTVETPVVAAKPRWLPWPALRWGAVTAAVVLVAIAVVLEAPRWGAEEKKEAALTKQAGETKTFASSAAPAASNAAAVQAAPADQEQAGKNEAARAKRKEEKQTEVAEVSAAKTANGPRDEATALDKMSAAPPAAPIVAAAQPAANVAAKDQKAGVEAAEVAAKPAEEPAATDNAVMASRAAAPPAPAPAKKAATTNRVYDEGPGFVGGSSSGQVAGGRMVSASVRWTVTSDGRVQRSPDGRNWYSVPVAKDVHFRALTSDGPRVWAGGNNAALYYSGDSGSSWKKMNIERLQGDIIRLIINNNTLTITTSSGQTMDVSSDGWNSDLGPRSNSPR